MDQVDNQYLHLTTHASYNIPCNSDSTQTFESRILHIFNVKKRDRPWDESSTVLESDNIAMIKILFFSFTCIDGLLALKSVTLYRCFFGKDLVGDELPQDRSWKV